MMHVSGMLAEHSTVLSSASDRPAQSLSQSLTSLHPQYMCAGHNVQLGDDWLVVKE